MTSKSLFFKLMQEDVKRRLWSIALLALLFFFTLPVTAEIVFQSAHTDVDKFSYFSSTLLLNPFVSFITVCAGVILGLSGFAYAHSRSKVDFYHSLPVRREVLFSTIYGSGLLIYVCTHLLGVLLCLLLGGIHRLLSPALLLTAVQGFGIQLLYFLLIYSFAVLAAMLTGHLVVSMLATAVLLLYGPICKGLVVAYMAHFFDTFYEPTTSPFYMLRHTSPLFALIYDHTQDVTAMTWPHVVGLLAVAIIILVLCGLLYLRRPSEAAGRALVFPISRPIIDFLLTIPGALGFGLFFNVITMEHGAAWLAFGVITGCILAHCISRIIFDFDFKSAVKGKGVFAICLVLSGAIATAFFLDLPGYDNYIPNQNKTASVSILMNDIQHYSNYNYKDNYPFSRTTYLLNNMSLEDKELAFYVITEFVKQQKNRNDTGDSLYNFTVHYTLQNGRQIYRCYDLPLTPELWVQMEQIFDDPGYQKGTYPILTTDPASIMSIATSSSTDAHMLQLSEEQRTQLMETYCSEFQSLQLRECMQKDPLTTLGFFNAENLELLKTRGSELTLDGSFPLVDAYPVYPSFTKTIALLQEWNVPLDIPDWENVTSITLYSELGNIISENSPMSATIGVSGDQSKECTYTDPAQIEQILPALHNSTYYNFIPLRDGIADYVYCYVESLSNAENNDITIIGYEIRFVSDLPDFVQEDLHIEEDLEQLEANGISVVNRFSPELEALLRS